METTEGVCAVCGGRFRRAALGRLAAESDGVAELVRRDRPGLGPDALICRDDRARYRRMRIERLLEAERGDLGALEREVLASLEAGAPVAEDVEGVYAERLGFGARAADAVAALGGSWLFIGGFCGLLLMWMALNVTGLAFRPFDPYPFILLNLVLSCVAALQAPIIMMSQRRQEEKDRLRAENDYKVNLKAELEIRHLHEKIDRHLASQWERLAEIQRAQIEMIEELAAREGRDGRG
ncbi:DUF1003 domain-containing protein [Amaricoccus sp.]|uniref:DUF1003 domain-containing protein n=1 Tax=Amaricoccus sp. TaxID=1872485 RepID=UPI0025C1114F|nr:DUF1003 domain-containing protein [Amaricoccus sp.]